MTPAPPIQGAVDACNLVTTAEVQAVIRSAVTTEPGGDATQSICTFSTADGTGRLYTSYSPDGVLSFDAWKTQEGTQTVPGLGDEAFFNPTVGVMVRRGTATYQFYALGDLTAADALALGVQIAHKASSRI